VLVCGLISLGSEELKSLRRAVKQMGFVCKMESGWLQVVSLDNKGDWYSLFRLLQIEPNIVPVYFKEGDRVIDLEYGKLCTEINGKIELCKMILLGWTRGVGLGLRFSGIACLNIIKRVNNGNN